MALNMEPKEGPGGTYCSPACGHGCTREAHDRAKRKGILLAEACGLGFKARVHENLGWHYAAVKGDARVIEHGACGYSCLLTPKGAPQVIGEGATPRDAILDAHSKALEISRRLADVAQALVLFKDAKA